MTLPQVLHSAKALLEAERVELMLVDRVGTLRWASASDRVSEAVAGKLRVPVEVGGGPVGTLDVYITAPRGWDDSAATALQAYAGLVASLLVATVTAQVKGELADQLQAALAHQSLIEQAVEILVDRDDLDRSAALGWPGTSARSSGAALVEVARSVVGGCRSPRTGSPTPRRGGATPSTLRLCCTAGLGTARG